MVVSLYFPVLFFLVLALHTFAFPLILDFPTDPVAGDASRHLRLTEIVTRTFMRHPIEPPIQP